MKGLAARLIPQAAIARHALCGLARLKRAFKRTSALSLSRVSRERSYFSSEQNQSM